MAKTAKVTGEKKPAQFKGFGIGLVNFASENTAEEIVRRFRDDCFSTLRDATELAEENLDLVAMETLEKARKILDFDQYEIKADEKVATAKGIQIIVSFTKEASPNYREFVSGFCKKFGSKVNSTKEGETYLFPAKTADVILARADKMVGVIVRKVS
jgi:vacuolar-type H+-ATPase subunit H